MRSLRFLENDTEGRRLERGSGRSLKDRPTKRVRLIPDMSRRTGTSGGLTSATTFSASKLREIGGHSDAIRLNFAPMVAFMKDENSKEGVLNRERDELYRYMVESATDFAIFSADPDRLITSWNVGSRTPDGLVGRRDRRPVCGYDLHARGPGDGHPRQGSQQGRSPKAGPRTSDGTCARTGAASGATASCCRSRTTRAESGAS